MDARDIRPETLRRLQAAAAGINASADQLLTRLLDQHERALADQPPAAIPYQLLLEHMTDTVSLFDLNLRYLYANPTLLKLTGLDPQEILGKTDAELGMPEANVTFWKEEWQQVIETRQERVITFDFLTTEGQRYYESRLTPILNDANEIISLLAITRDVTNRTITEQMLRDIANRLPGMILSYRLKEDGSDEVPFVSDGIEALYELSTEEAYADPRRIWQKVHPDDLDNLAASIRESARTLDVWQDEWRVRMSDGSIKWIAGRGTPRRLEDGSTVWHTLLLDITDRKLLEQRQQELLEQLQLAIATAKLGIWRVIIADGRVQWNEQMFALHGISHASMPADIAAWREYIHPDDRDYTDGRFEAILLEGQTFDVNFRIVRPDGEIRYITSAAQVLRDTRGEPVALVGVNMDVTHIRHSEIRLQQSNEMLESIIEHIPVMIALFDQLGRFRYVNQYWIDKLGWNAEELAEFTDPLEVFQPDPAYRQEVLNYMLTAAPGWRDFRVHTRSGAVLDTSWANVRLSDGRTIGIGQDITERKAAQQMALERERLLASLKMEKDHLDAVQRIVAKVAHDLKTPLSVITVSRDILSNYFERINAEQRRERLESIGMQLQYVTDLLNDLTNIGTLEVDSNALQLTSTNVSVMCQIAIQDIQESIGAAHRLVFEEDRSVGFAMIDAMLLNRILLNLLTNAVKYSPEASTITLWLGSQNQQMILQVRDQGIGIAAEHLPHIFEPFYRVDVTKGIEGSGLGLSIVRDCVERHKGHISVESVIGRGTTFTVQIPLIVPMVKPA